MAEPSLPAGDSPPIEIDAVVIGAGPVGLFQVFQLGLLDIKAHIVDVLPYPGGQPVELYPDKPIYDIPAVPVCTGRELTDALLRQMAPFGAQFHLGQMVSVVERQPDGRFLLVTDRLTRLLCRSVFVAAGVGAFEPKRLKLPGIEAFETRQLFYHVRNPADHANRHLVIVGGDETAVRRAIEFAQPGPHRAASVTLVHRRDLLKTQADGIDRLRELHHAGSLQLAIGQVTGFETANEQLGSISVTDPEGQVQSLSLDHLLVFQGLSPKLGPLTHWGLQLERKQLVVDTETCSTSTPGIFAVGDVNHYPGKKKLIVCGFHECVMAAYAAAPLIHPDRPVRLEYTTSSSRLHQLLGVAGTDAATPSSTAEQTAGMLEKTGKMTL